MNKLTFTNKVWAEQKPPLWVRALALALFVYLFMQTIIFMMEGVSPGSAMLALLALAVFMLTVSALLKKGSFVEADAVLSESGDSLILEYPSSADILPACLWHTDPARRRASAVYNRELAYILIKGMADAHGRISDIHIYDTAPLDDIRAFLENSGVEVTVIEKAPDFQPPENKGQDGNDRYISITGRDLTNILWTLSKDTERRFINGTLFVSQEFLFEYQNNSYIVGIKYDKKAAKKEGETDFCIKYMTVYMDGHVFEDPEDFYENAVVHGVRIKDIAGEIYVARDEFRYFFRKEEEKK